MTMLRIEDLTASYGEGPVLEDISLQVDPGEVVGLLGPNGASKSSLLNCILGHLYVVSGLIKFEAHDLSKQNADGIPRLGIGMVPQEKRAFPGLTVQENLLAGHQQVPVRSERFEQVINRFPQIRERLRQRAGTLSGGEQQLVAIARAQLTKPKLMLLDEPAEGLMPSLVGQVEQWIAELRAEGVGVLWAEQRAESAIRLCDRLYVLNHGQIAWEGIPSELDDSSLKRLFRLDVK